MATIASVDKTLSRVSAWMSSVAFAGVMALAFLPMRGRHRSRTRRSPDCIEGREGSPGAAAGRNSNHDKARAVKVVLDR